jgi:hypothetical protein
MQCLSLRLRTVGGQHLLSSEAVDDACFIAGGGYELT